jgi:hypothetical protein
MKNKNSKKYIMLKCKWLLTLQRNDSQISENKVVARLRAAGCK